MAVVWKACWSVTLSNISLTKPQRYATITVAYLLFSGDYMKKRTTALLCVGIPLLVGVGLVIDFGLACILEFPTNRGIIYSIFASISIIGSIFVPIPSIVSSIAGIISAAKLRKQGEKSGYLILIGIFNIVVSFVVAIFWLYVIFVGGAGV